MTRPRLAGWATALFALTTIALFSISAVSEAAIVGPAGSGLHWKQSTLSATAPSPRNRVAMAFDSKDGYMVEYGGYTGSSGILLYSTWLNVKGYWSQAGVSAHPTAPVGLVLAYDPALGGVLAFGGVNPFLSSTYYNDTWLFHRGNWTQLTPTASPPPRGYYEMTYDPADSEMVMFGGDDANGANTLSDTWAFTGTTWVRQHPTTVPNGTETGGMAYDAASHQVLLFGGRNATAGASPPGTWAFHAGNWTQLKSSRTPLRNLISATSTYNGTPIFFGGYAGTSAITCSTTGGPCNQTFAFYSGSWHKVSASHPPAGRAFYGFAYDPKFHGEMLFGGSFGYGSALNETWILN